MSGATETPVLLARDLVVSYGPVRAVDTLSLAVSAGRVVAVTGESGAGKSSLLWALAGALPPTSGSVQLPSGSGDRPAVALLPQSFALAAVLTATENVVVPLLASGVGPGEAAQRAADALASLGLEDVGDHVPDELSGGQRQRVALARALAGTPRLLVVDEPTSALDHANRERVLGLLREAATVGGAAVVIATHDPEVAAVADEEWHLDAGRASLVRGNLF